MTYDKGRLEEEIVEDLMANRCRESQKYYNIIKLVKLHLN